MTESVGANIKINLGEQKNATIANKNLLKESRYNLAKINSVAENVDMWQKEGLKGKGNPFFNEKHSDENVLN